MARVSAREALRARSERRPFGVRLYLALAFAAVALIAAGLSYVLASGSSESAAQQSSSELAVGRTVHLADAIGAAPSRRASEIVEHRTHPSYSAWVYNLAGRRVTARASEGVTLGSVPGHRQARAAALRGGRLVKDMPGAVTVVSQPIFRDGQLVGAVVARAARAGAVERALSSLRGHRLTAAIIAVIVAALLGALIATAITSRVKRLADSAARISEGRLDDPLEGLRGRDEITDLGRAFETMRIALKETFGALRSERDRLTAIFDALDDAVIVTGAEGQTRFTNPAANRLVLPDGRVSEPIQPWLERALARGAVEHDGIRVGERVYALNARKLPTEGGVLIVVRDRTDELRREAAEREFVSNAAHELRNPIAGLSGAIEVLRAGAKDDPDAREHFLARLASDADRVARLTEALLTLARVEAVGEGGSGPIDVAIAAEEAIQAVSAPEGVELELELEPELAAEGDAVLLRQVLMGLLTNAFKNTPSGGTVSVRACRAGEDGVRIEVADTGKGIAPEDIDRIFERFYRGSGSLEQEGFGLGLAIAKRMVDVMGGEIGVESEVGTGSTFWIRLRAAQPAPTPVA
jgi:two-component system, OmpR family, phosphate regulon sensor histidine kinase PhoR